jgi:hypothetical protein
VLCILFNSWDDNIYRKRREEMDARIKENKERTALLKMLEYADRNMGMDDRIRPDDIVMEASKELMELSLENKNLKKENAELIFEIGDLKNKLAVACHVKYGGADAFDWDILHRIWDLENALARIIGMCGGFEIINSCTCGRPTGLGAVVSCAESALKRSRGE